MSEQQIRFCTSIDGVSIAYATTGQGYPLVKAANWLGHLQFDLKGIWNHWITELSKYNQLVRFDQRGCGLSERTVRDFSFEGCVNDLEAVVDSLGLEHFDLLGISHGGSVSIAYAVRHPERVSHLILYGAFAKGWAKLGLSAQKVEEMEAVAKLMRLGWGRDNPAFRQIFTSGFMPDATAEQMHAFNEYQKVSTSPENAVQLWRVIGDTDVFGLLPKVSVPTIVFHARGDQEISFRNGVQLAASIQGARIVPLESRNHILLENEGAWKEFLLEFRRFLGVKEEAAAAVPSMGGRTPTLMTTALDDTSELRRTASILVPMNVVSLSRYRVVGSYFRFEEEARNGLKDIRQKILAAFKSSALKRENYLLWAPPGSGKTFFIQQVAVSLKGENVRYLELNLAQTEETRLRSALEEVQKQAEQQCLCFVDEIDARPSESWPYEALLPYMDNAASRGARWVFVVAGSSGSSLSEMKKGIVARPKGTDLLSRIPSENEHSIPAMSLGDRLLVTMSQFVQTSKKMGRNISEVEKMALLYIMSSPNLSSARQLSEFAVRCVERAHSTEDRIKYDNLFDPGNPENKEFWVKTQGIAEGLVNSFVGLQD